jgi:hypothetical protein
MRAAEDAIVRLESAASSGRLLDAYDATQDCWNVPFKGPFWDAVAHAHTLGQRGAGRRIAVIDTAFDLTIPALKTRVNSLARIAPEPVGVEDTSHGTEVALLIARVAPEARLDVYTVAGEEGRIDRSNVVYAIEQATQSGADIINLSLGVGPKVPDLTDRMLLSESALVRDYLEGPHPWGVRKALTDAVVPHANCDLCAAASAAWRAGKMVFAAVGNDGQSVLCPARSAGVVAVGFMSELRTIVQSSDGETTETAASGMPQHAPQALINDISLSELDGVLGTSFASPLYAGAAALGVTPGELAAYLEAIVPGELATSMNKAANFTAAMQRLPHVHSGYEAFLRGGAPVADPSKCVTCGLFAQPTYINFGLWLLTRRYLSNAHSILEAAVALAPWSAEAAADYGRALQFEGRLAEALQWYDKALTLRPDSSVYADHRALLVKEIQAVSPAS